MKWILGNFKYDLWLILPGLAGILLVSLEQVPAAWIYLMLFVMIFVDAGHVFTTFLRTHVKNPDKKSVKKFNLISLGIFLVMAAWALIAPSGVIPFIVYATLFHHVRQHYGIVRWYDRSNNVKPYPLKYSIFYFLLFSSALGFHFRPLSGSSQDVLYSGSDLYLLHNPLLQNINAILFVSAASLWLLFTCKDLINNKQVLPAKLYEFSAIACYTWAGFFANSFSSAALPLLISHGIPYFALMSLSLVRTRKDTFRSAHFAIGAVALTALAAGIIDKYIDHTWMENIYTLESWGLWPSLAVAAYLTPLLSHYIYDGIIWRQKYPESTIVYQEEDKETHAKSA